ncbi:MAG: UDP-N-acetylmuramoyl-L-alanyl-D-glutamate--2,6-diaminopimelate ligase [Candidatus Omnitrophota bacterium]
MLLRDLLKGIYSDGLSYEHENFAIDTISCDSRQKQANGLFVALSGFKVKGDDFIKDAIVQGAVAVVKKGRERKLSNYTIPDSVCLLDVDDPKLFLRQIALRFYDDPSGKVKTIGVTGTNGKTTITYLLESIFKVNGQDSAVIGTVNYRIAGKILPSKLTTPGFLENQSYLFQLANSRIPYCVMEVSAHALEQGRVDGINFSSAIFTNLTQDHLDYFKDMESYFRTKTVLFERLQSDAGAIINVDDPYGRRLLEMSKGKVVTYGIKNSADVKAQDVQFSLKGTKMEVVFPTGKITINTCFIGEHNVYNILAACACAWDKGVAIDTIRRGVEALFSVPGRLEPIKGSQDYFIFIDYAHTPDGLENVLKALRAVSANKIILVFGCGGDRDRGKRPLMAQVACERADYSVVTSDNPRSEDPMSIIKEIMSGFKGDNYEVITDRKEAIVQALRIVKSGEIVLIAGKGHEDYQILKDKTIPFNEVSIVKEILSNV